MGVLTVSIISNDHKVYFDEPLERFEFIRLTSCCLYNSWFNLKNRGEIEINETAEVLTTKIIPPGNYNLETIGKKLHEVFEKKKVLITFDDEKGPFFIKRINRAGILFSIVT